MTAKLLITSILVAVFQSAAAQVWTTGATMPEIVRAGNTASYSSNGEDYLFVVSGRNADGFINNKNYKYQLSTDSWTEVANHPTGILSCGTVILKDSLYTIGGVVTTPGAYTRKVYKYSINENTWSQVADHPVNIIDTEAVAYQDSLIYVVGGFNTRKVRVYNSAKNSWRDATSITPPGQTISWGSLAVRNDTLVYMCGARNFLSNLYDNTVRIGVIDQNDRSVINWTTATPFPGESRTFFDTHPWQNGLIMTGGSTDNTFETASDECYYYNVGNDSWLQLPSKPTAWNTGNSGSFLANDEWKLVCTAGYNNGYLEPTEIFSSPVLSNSAFNYANNCGIKNLVITQNPNPVLKICLDTADSIQVNLYSLTGTLVYTIPQKNCMQGQNDIPFANDVLRSGIYICVVSNTSESISKKLIISKND